ncbi:MAG TPA: ATP-grasp domain-containing protein [Alphaproteobacteria bacterium]|nr:ATP-grasp domain-containing protein [Alphaproteobacteria bacterium]
MNHGAALPAGRKAAIAITGFEGLDVAGSGLSIARALRAADEEASLLLALTSDSIPSAGMVNGVTDMAAFVPALLEHTSEAIDQILALHKSIPIRALIPGNNDHAQLLAQSGNRLAASGIRTFLPQPQLFDRLAPEVMRKFLGNVPIEIMVSGTLASIADAMECAEILAFPTTLIAQSQKRVVWSPSELRAHLKRLNPNSNSRVRAVPADFSSGYRVACLAEDGVLGPVVVTRILGSTNAGDVAASTVVDDPYICYLTARIVEALEWTGPLEFELRRSVDTAPLVLIWAECSLPKWSMLAHWAGCNLASALLSRIETGKMPEAKAARAGTIAARCTYETVLAPEIAAAFSENIVARHKSPTHVPKKTTSGPSVAVTGLSVSDVINPGVGVSRALRVGTHVGQLIGIGYTALDAGAYDPALYDEVFRFDFPRTAGSYRAQILSAAKTTRIDALVSCLDDELVYAIAIADDLAKNGIATLLPTLEALEKRSKTTLFGSDLRGDWGAFAIPRSQVVANEYDARKAVSLFNNAAVVKGARYLCTPVHNATEAASAWRRLRSQDSFGRVIIQEQLDGPSYAVSVVCNRKHEVVSSLTIRKEALCPRGSTWGAVSVSEPKLEAAFGQMLREIGWVGPAEGEFMLDRRRRRFYLIEVNPRFTAWIAASAMMGPNQPLIAVKLALGVPFKAPSPAPGKLFLRASDEVRITASKLSEFATRRTFRHG